MRKIRLYDTLLEYILCSFTSNLYWRLEKMATRIRLGLRRTRTATRTPISYTIFGIELAPHPVRLTSLSVDTVVSQLQILQFTPGTY